MEFTPSADYNVPSPPSLLFAGLLAGAPIHLDPTSLKRTEPSGYRIRIGTVQGSCRWDHKGGVQGVVALKVVGDNEFRAPRSGRREARFLAEMDHRNVSLQAQL